MSFFTAHFVGEDDFPVKHCIEWILPFTRGNKYIIVDLEGRLTKFYKLPKSKSILGEWLTNDISTIPMSSPPDKVKLASCGLNNIFTMMDTDDFNKMVLCLEKLEDENKARNTLDTNIRHLGLMSSSKFEYPDIYFVITNGRGVLGKSFVSISTMCKIYYDIPSSSQFDVSRRVVAHLNSLFNRQHFNGVRGLPMKENGGFAKFVIKYMDIGMSIVVSCISEGKNEAAGITTLITNQLGCAVDVITEPRCKS